MTWIWTTEQLRTAISLCEAVCEKMIAEGAAPAQLEYRRQGIDVLYRLLDDAEHNDINKQDQEG